MANKNSNYSFDHARHCPPKPPTPPIPPDEDFEARITALENEVAAAQVRWDEAEADIAAAVVRVAALENAPTTNPDLTALIARIVALEAAGTGNPQAPDFSALVQRVEEVEAKATASLARMDKAMKDMNLLSVPRPA